MAVTLTLTQKVEAAGGVSVSEYPVISTDEYAVLNVAVPHGTSDLEVAVGAALADMKMLAIIASAYPETTGVKNLSVKFHDAGNDPVLLDNMLLISGAGACAEMIPGECDSLFFSNDHASTDVTVTIIVAKDSTP